MGSAGTRTPPDRRSPPVVPPDGPLNGLQPNVTTRQLSSGWSDRAGAGARRIGPMQEALGLRCHAVSDPCWPVVGGCFWSRRAPSWATHSDRRCAPPQSLDPDELPDRCGQAWQNVGRDILSWKHALIQGARLLNKSGFLAFRIKLRQSHYFPIMISKRGAQFHAWRLGTYVPATHL
jgi:hypothetical protein